jgi:hypothetical protein
VLRSRQFGTLPRDHEDLLDACPPMGSDIYPDVVKGSWVLVVRQCHRCEILETYIEVVF